eukprot:scaffold41226_cov54-Phaeocystis_antarctica.AAC.2
MGGAVEQHTLASQLLPDRRVLRLLTPANASWCSRCCSRALLRLCAARRPLTVATRTGAPMSMRTCG